MARTRKPKKIKGYYYEITKSNKDEERCRLKSTEVVDIFETIKSIPWNDRKRVVNGTYRTFVFPEDPTDFNIPDYGDRFINGALVNFRENFNPMIITETEQKVHVAPIKINDNQKLGEIAYFMIHKESGLMLLIGNRFAGSEKTLSTMLHYLMADNPCMKQIKHKLNVEILDILPLIEHDQMIKLANMNKIKMLSMSFRVIPSGNDIPETTGDSMDDIISYLSDNQSNLGFETVTLRFSAGKSRGISKTRLKKEIRKALNSKKKIAPQKIKVEGNDQFDKHTEIDFITDKFLFSTTLPLEEGKNWPETESIFEEMAKSFTCTITSLLNPDE